MSESDSYEYEELVELLGLNEKENVKMVDREEIKNMSFFGRMFSSKFRMLLRELEHENTLHLEETKASFDRERSVWKEDKERLRTQLIEEHELKLKEYTTLARLDYEQKTKQIELIAERKINAEVAKINKDYYDKLTDSMKKLHEEGNVTTKFTQELALKMMSSLPANKTTTKVLTGRAEKDVDG